MKRKNKRRFQASCENLEGRQLLSGVTASLNNASNQTTVPGVLMINGTSGDDTIHVTQSGSNLEIQGVTINWTLPSIGTWPVAYVVANMVTQIQINM